MVRRTSYTLLRRNADEWPLYVYNSVLTFPLCFWAQQQRTMQVGSCTVVIYVIISSVFEYVPVLFI